MTQNDVFLQNLANVKYLWLQAEEQARQAEPFCGFALMPMQDSVEMFILTGLTKHNVKIKDNMNLSEMWDALDAKITTPLTQRPAIFRVNKARVALKHHSSFPSLSQLNEYLVHVKTFFAENTPSIFNVDFENISLADLIITEEVRTYIKEAENLLKQNNLNGSVIQCALGMDKLIDIFNRKAYGEGHYHNPISDLRSLMKEVRINPEYQGGASREMQCVRSLTNQTEKFADKVVKMAEKLDDFIRFSALGIPYGKFIRFNAIVPEVIWFMNGTYKIYDHALNVSHPNSAQFCISFVVECALKEQSFQWT